MKITTLLFGAVLLGLAGASLATAQDPAEIMRKSHQTYYYAGDGGHARVQMVLTDKKGRTREREFWMLRSDIADMGDQRYYTYFLKPADVSRTAFLVHKKAEGGDDRWLYMPSLDLVKRIAADDRGSSFVGSDFTYEDVSGRLPSLDQHELLGNDTALDRPAFKIKSTPVEAGTADWAHRVSWIDQATFLPLKEEYVDKRGETVRLFEIRKIEEIEGIPTAVVRSMSDTKKGSRTELSFSEMTYVAKIAADGFNERLLKSPPSEYTR